MKRCIQLAKLGEVFVAPNPMVGAILVYENRIIGEGYHQQFGHEHAEVNCINSVKEEDKGFLNKCVLYVSLEPCAHYGKTPPCSDLIIRKKIPKVIIGCRDGSKKVNGKGIEKLLSAGVDVKVGVLEKECINLNKRFFTFHEKQRPYIILKWAQTADNKIAGTNQNRLKISNEITNRLVHKWRSEEQAILVGTNTAMKDNPFLTSRLWSPINPVRLVIDKNLKLPGSLKIFNTDAPTLVFNYLKNNINFTDSNLKNEVYYYKLDSSISMVKQVLDVCFQINIQSILVEGGATLLKSFIDEKFYDEVRIITNTKMNIGNGLNPPGLPLLKKLDEFTILNDVIKIFQTN